MEKKQGFFRWLFMKWHFWILSVGWAIWSSSEDIASGDFFGTTATIIVWIIIIGLLYFIIFQIIKSFKIFISRKVEEELDKKN